MSDRINKDVSEAWRDHVLKQMVDYLKKIAMKSSIASKRRTLTT